MNRIQPKEEIIYPDKGGYTGFSLFLWDISGITGEILLESKWGGFYADGESGLRERNGNFILEGRVYIFGSLRERELLCYPIEKDAREYMAELNRTWTPKMNKLKLAEEKMWEEPDRRGIHIDEILPIWEDNNVDN